MRALVEFHYGTRLVDMALVPVGERSEVEEITEADIHDAYEKCLKLKKMLDREDIPYLQWSKGRVRRLIGDDSVDFSKNRIQILTLTTKGGLTQTVPVSSEWRWRDIVDKFFIVGRRQIEVEGITDEVVRIDVRQYYEGESTPIFVERIE